MKHLLSLTIVWITCTVITIIQSDDLHFYFLYRVVRFSDKYFIGKNEVPETFPTSSKTTYSY